MYNNLTPITKELLKQRGIVGEAAIAEYLSDRPKEAHDPELLLNLPEAAERILLAAEKGEKLCIYGDYDADGITSVAILHTVLSELFPRELLSYHIPSRFTEGYGLNNAALDDIAAAGVTLVVTVDCGCVSVGEVEHAKELGMDIIVTDHHSMDETRLPDCLIVNPRQKTCPYPYKGLAGCGVAFKLAQSIQRRTGLSRKMITELLDICAVGTIGDVMPLTGENRTIVKYGLKALKAENRPAFRALIEGAQLKKEKINSENIAFTIVPQLNAAGRLRDASIAEELLLEKDAGRIEERARELLLCNRERKDIQDGLYADCIELAEELVSAGEKVIIVTPSRSHEGIAGIVAGRLRDRYYLPALILSESENGMLKGTGRSIEGVDIHAVLTKHSHFFEKFGGHSAACGFSMKGEKLPAFREEIGREFSELATEKPMLFKRPIIFDMDAAPEDMSIELCEELELLEPFGKDNSKPVFRLRGQTVRNLQFMGQEGTHAKFKCGSEENPLEAVLFSKARDRGYAPLLLEGKRVDIIGSPEISEWNGLKRVQFIIKEME